MNIRTVTPNHAPLSLLLQADPSLERVRQYLQSGVVFVGEENGITVAVALLQTTDAEMELKNIAVAESHQRRGLGRQMIAHVLKYAAQHGVSRVMVGTGNSSLGQLAFYQKNGFRVVGVISDFFAAYDPPIIENGIPCRDMIRLAFNPSR